MGRYTDYLCYKIWYAAANDKKNEVNFTSLFFPTFIFTVAAL